MLLEIFYSVIYSAEGGDHTDLIKKLHESVEAYNKISAELKKKEYTAHKELLQNVKKEDEKDITKDAANVQVKILEMLKELTEFNSKHLKELDGETRKKVLEKTKERVKNDNKDEREKEDSEREDRGAKTPVQESSPQDITKL